MFEKNAKQTVKFCVNIIKITVFPGLLSFGIYLQNIDG